jgi:hypothetical protein
MTKDEALKLALKNLLVATKHLDVCPGTVQAAEEALAQPEPVMDYDKEELRGTVWDTNKQTLAQPEQCVCGEPLRLNIVHRKDSPCFDYLERKWVGLNWSDLPEEWVGDTKFLTGARWAEEILEEKNHD